MLLQHRKIVLDKIEELAAVTHHLDKIMEKLLEYHILNEFMVRHLRNKYYELKRRNKEFYLMMLGRGPRAFDALVSVLRRTENFRAEELLCEYKVCHVHGPSVAEEVICPPPIDELDLGPPKNRTPADIIVQKHPEDKFMDCPVEGDARGTYRMRSKPRGHAIIINIYKTAGLPDRRGSDVDYCKLDSLFKQLGFKVFPNENLTDVDIKKEVGLRKTDPELANVDCLVVFIMCHGRQKGHLERSDVELLASNGQPINTNWLANEFQCPALKDKPKLFFFQACRIVKEEKRESGTIIRYGKNIEMDSELISCKENESERLYDDTFLGFATLPGEVSIRHPETGSWFVDAFCKVIAEKAYHLDLDDLWFHIDDEIRKKVCYKGYQTSELVKRGRNKHLFFNPQLYE